MRPNNPDDGPMSVSEIPILLRIKKSSFLNRFSLFKYLLQAVCLLAVFGCEDEAKPIAQISVARHAVQSNPQPELTLASGVAEPVCGQFTVHVDFDYGVDPADLSLIEPSISVTNGAFVEDGWDLASPDNTEWEFEVLPNSGNDNPVLIQIEAGAYQNISEEDNLASNVLEVSHNGVGPNPQLSLGTGESLPVCGQFSVRINFDQGIDPADLSLVVDDLVITNGTFVADSWNLVSGNNEIWEFDVLPTSDNDTTVTVQLYENAYEDLCSRNNISSNILSVPLVCEVDTDTGTSIEPTDTDTGTAVGDTETGTIVTDTDPLVETDPVIDTETPVDTDTPVDTATPVDTETTNDSSGDTQTQETVDTGTLVDTDTGEPTDTGTDTALSIDTETAEVIDSDIVVTTDPTVDSDTVTGSPELDGGVDTGLDGGGIDVDSGDTDRLDTQDRDTEDVSTGIMDTAITGDTDTLNDTLPPGDTSTGQDTGTADIPDTDQGTGEPRDTGPEPACDEGEMRCDDDMAQICRDGEWDDWTDCGALGQDCILVEGRAECVSTDDDTASSESPEDSDSEAVDAGLEKVEGGACQCRHTGAETMSVSPIRWMLSLIFSS